MRRILASIVLTATLLTHGQPAGAQSIEQEVAQCRRQCVSRCAAAWRPCLAGADRQSGVTRGRARAQCNRAYSACQRRCVEVECMT